MQGRPLLGLLSDNLRTQLQLVCFQVLSHFSYLDEIYFCDYVVASGLLTVDILSIVSSSSSMKLSSSLTGTGLEI